MALAAALPRPVATELARIVEDGARVGVALSAGADSTFALIETIRHLGTTKVVALHYDHGLRGEESDGDAAAAERIAEHFGVAFIKASRPAGLPADEATLRRDRLNFLRSQAHTLGLAAIITGHHADDVAETLVMRLARGSGAAGLAAPRAISRHRDGTVFLRPLLLHRKQDIIRTLTRLGVDWREDSGNARPEIARRNALRAEVMPLWERLAGPKPIAGALRTRELLQEDDDALEHWTTRMVTELGLGTPHEDWRQATALPRAVLRRLLHRHMIHLGKQGAISARAFDTLLDHLAQNNATTVSVAGEFLRFDGTTLALVTSLAPATRDSALLPVPGCVCWPDGACLTVTRKDSAHASEPAHPDIGHVLQCATVNPGERYRPIGATGSAKIRDMMTNRKIPRTLRDSLPVVSDRHGPLWVPGLVPAARLAKSAQHPPALQLTWTAPRAP